MDLQNLDVHNTKRQSAHPDENSLSEFQNCSLSKLPGVIQDIPAKTTLYCEGEPSETVYEIVSGSVKLYKSMRDGRNLVTEFALPGDVIGVNNSGYYGTSADTVCRTRLRRFLRNRLDRAADADFTVRKKLMLLTAASLSSAHQHMLVLGRTSTLERIAMFLLRLSLRQRDRGEAPDEVHLPMTRRDIADHLGLTAETVCRSLTKLRSLDMIEVPNQHMIRILDREGLFDMANGEIEAGAL